MPERTLVVKLVGDERSLLRAFKQSEKAAQGLEGRVVAVGRGVGGLFRTAGVTLGAAAIVTGLQRAGLAASDLNEQVSKSRQVFGDSSAAVEAWADTTATSLGVAKAQALAATGTFGNLLRTVDVAPEKAAEMSRALVTLAADLASFNNASPEDVLQAIRSGLIGEAEPLRRYGVLLSEARVQQLALADTGKKSTKELSDQEKALARYKIILQDTIPAQGDFERTSEGLANQTRILKANLADLAAELGSRFVPALEIATRAANALFDAIRTPGTRIEIPVDADLEGLRRVRDEVAAIGGESNLMVEALDKAIAKLREFRNAANPRPDDRAGPRGPGGVAQSNIEVQERQRREELQKAEAALEDSRKRFQALIKGLGLKLDRAQLEGGIDNEIAVLREVERAILRQINREGRTFVLVERLIAVRTQIQSAVAARADAQAQASRDAFTNMLDALNLRLDRARATERFDDDLRELAAIERALEQRIASEGRTVELERQLFAVQQERAEIRREQAQQAREARDATQFRTLGLTDTGEERVPGLAGLRRQFDQVGAAVEGTFLDTKKTRSVLQGVRKVLSGELGALSEDVRRTVAGILDNLNRQLDDQRRPLTKFRVVNTDQVLAGLGLDDDTLKALRGRLARLGPGGTVPQFTRTGGAFGLPVTAPAGGGIFINSVQVNNPQDFNAFIHEVEKRAQRTTGTRSGTRAGG